MTQRLVEGVIPVNANIAKPAVFDLQDAGDTRPITTAGVGLPAHATVTATEHGNGVIHQTVLTLAATPVTMRDTEQGGGIKIYDFPAGRILFLGASGSIQVTTTSAIATTLKAAKTCNWGVGTTTQASATVATTEQDLLQVAAFTSSATINVAPAVASGVGAAIVTPFDGTSTAIDAYLNLAIAGAGDIDGNATTTTTGTITLNWINLGTL